MNAIPNSIVGKTVCLINHSGTAQELFDKLKEPVRQYVTEIGNIRLEICVPDNAVMNGNNVMDVFEDKQLMPYQTGFVSDVYHIWFKRDELANKVHNQNATMLRNAFN